MLLYEMYAVIEAAIPMKAPLLRNPFDHDLVSGEALLHLRSAVLRVIELREAYVDSIDAWRCKTNEEISKMIFPDPIQSVALHHVEMEDVAVARNSTVETRGLHLMTDAIARLLPDVRVLQSDSDSDVRKPFSVSRLVLTDIQEGGRHQRADILRSILAASEVEGYPPFLRSIRRKNSSSISKIEERPASSADTFSRNHTHLSFFPNVVDLDPLEFDVANVSERSHSQEAQRLSEEILALTLRFAEFLVIIGEGDQIFRLLRSTSYLRRFVERRFKNPTTDASTDKDALRSQPVVHYTAVSTLVSSRYTLEEFRYFALVVGVTGVETALAYYTAGIVELVS
jgi:hypothetical protein